MSGEWIGHGTELRADQQVSSPGRISCTWATTLRWEKLTLVTFAEHTVG
jgi:hypothetical protein